MIIVTVVGLSRAMRHLIAMHVHRCLSRRLAGSRVVDTLLQVEWELMLVGNLRNSMWWGSWRHRMCWERSHLEHPGVSQMDSGVSLISRKCNLPKDWSLVSWLQATSQRPVLFWSWLDSFDMIKRIELCLD